MAWSGVAKTGQRCPHGRGPGGGFAEAVSVPHRDHRLVISGQRNEP